MRDLHAFAIACALAACGPAGRGGNGGDDDGSPPDSMQPDGNLDPSEMAFVFAHSPSTLYRIDPDTLAVSTIGAFQWPNGGSDQMTDLAINSDNVMIGISFGSVYRVDPATAATTRLPGSLSGAFNGLSFVPAEMLGQTGPDVLVATRNDDGKVFRVDPMTGAADEVGNMGAAFQSSGDIVSVKNFGTVVTTLGAPFDVLTKLTPVTFAGSPAPSSTGFGQIWGVAFWKGTVFGFTQTGKFITINPNTGVATLVQDNGPEWWGAAVTTSAPIVQ
ncbi:MAG: hypothetical protein KF773_28840 [Deltaproteobacteria bacterium]|nr:hypothetical protein [Deltaproteobacteria bacterium]MCW5805670.1 hypothetical protein [Deltaproteobacteria bacterium]